MWTSFVNFLQKGLALAAQKEKFETKIMLLEAKHENAIEKLETENRDLRAKIDPLTHELKQCQAALSFLQQQQQNQDTDEPPEPSLPGANAGL